MAQYISKSDLVAEIERRIKINKECMLGLRNLDYYQGKVDALSDTISFINSLQKEPKECMYSKDNYTDEDRKVLFGDCEEECEFNKKEEPVSEDLEEASKEWLRPQLDKSYANYGEVKMMELTHFDGYAMLDAIEFGAQWQQEKDSIPAEYLEELINKLSKQFPEVSFAKLSRIVVRVSRWQQNQDVKNKLPKVTDKTDLDEYAYQCAYDMSNDWAIEYPTWHDVEDACKLGAKWQKTKDESTTEDLGEYINELSKQFPEVSFAKLSRIAVRVAKWQKEHLWKHADDDDLPIIDREVIALLDNGKVVFAHRPPEYWDGKNIITGKVTRYYPKTYDKGGWNIPDVRFWLDVKLPKEIEL